MGAVIGGYFYQTMSHDNLMGQQAVLLDPIQDGILVREKMYMLAYRPHPKLLPDPRQVFAKQSSLGLLIISYASDCHLRAKIRSLLRVVQLLRRTVECTQPIDPTHGVATDEEGYFFTVLG